MNEESKTPNIDPETEARIIAFVLGEASEFECVQLNQLMESQPELLAFKIDMQRVHGLLTDVGATEFQAPSGDWKLPSEKRNAVLAVIRGEATVQRAASYLNPAVASGNLQTSENPAVSSSDMSSAITRRWKWNPAHVAVALCLAAFMGFLILPTVHNARDSSGHFTEAAKTESETSHVDFTGGSNVAFSIAPRRGTTPDIAHLHSTVERYKAGRSSNPQAALSALQDSLNFAPAVSEGESSGFKSSLHKNWAGFAVAEPDVPVVNGPAAVTRSISPQTAAPDNGLNLPATSSGGIELPQLIADYGVRWEFNGRNHDRRPEIGQQTSPQDTVFDFYNRQDAEPDSSAEQGLVAPAMPAEAGETINGTIVLHDGDQQWDRLEQPLALQTESLSVAGRGRSRLGGINQHVIPEIQLSDEAESQTELGEQLLERNSDLRFGNQPEPSSRFRYAVPTESDRVEAVPGNNFLSNPNPASNSEQQQITGQAAAETDASNLFGRVSGGLQLQADLEALAPASLGISHAKSDLDRQMPSAKEQLGEIKSAPQSGSSGNQSGQKLSVQSSRAKADGYANSYADSQDNWSLNYDFGFTGVSPGSGGQTSEDQSRVSESKKTHPFGEIVIEGEDSKLLEKNPSEANRESLKSVDGEEVPAVNLLKQQRRAIELDSVPPSLGRMFRSAPVAPARAKQSKLDRSGSEKQEDLQRYSKQPRFDMSGRQPEKEVTEHELFWYAAPQEKISAQNLKESATKENAFSTFSLHVSDVSFKLALAALVKGEWPDAAKIRIEEFVNAFDYGDPMPSAGEKVACQVEQSIHPFLQQRNLLRISMKTGAAGRASTTPLRLTFLLDNSGSMERPDRQQTIRQAFQLLAKQLNPTDQVTLISFARQPRLLADSVSGADAEKLIDVIEDLPSEGGTNIEAALQLAYEKAKEHQSSNAQNRIILLTDGAVNLGNANPESLSQMVASIRNSGIAFDAAGIVADGLNDEVLEALARQGDGRYYLLGAEENAGRDFAKQIAGALRPSAKNVKVQIEFNPKRVDRYKLLGFEKHILKKQDFRNDKVDAAEMAAAEAGVALYQFQAMPDGEGDVGSVSVRFQDLSTGQMVEHKWPIPYRANAPRIDQATASMRVAAAAALLAAKLRGEALGESVDLKALAVLVDGLPEANRSNERIQMLQTMIQKARQLAGE